MNTESKPDKKKTEPESEPETAIRKVEYYVPPKLPDPEQLLKERKALHLYTGGNFYELLNVPVRITGADPPLPVKNFEDMKLNEVILDTLRKNEYRRPTPVQENAIPALSRNRDVMACSQTGSGKTAAYLLPILNKLLQSQVPRFIGLPARPQAVILAPVRELAVQIAKECKMYSNKSGLHIRVVYGGTSCGSELYVLKGGCNILVATPGRLVQLLEEQNVVLKDVIYFILDEADRMLDMGFTPDVKKIASNLPDKRTSAMFSATFPTQVQRAADNFLKTYVFIAVGHIGGASTDVHQVFHLVERAEKRKKVFEVLQDISVKDKVIIFCSTRDGVDILTEVLNEHQVQAFGIHGEKAQREREIALKGFMEGTNTILVATSVAARGLDIPKVALVINYDLPTDIEDYIHRIGRTGRAGHSGQAVSFFEYYGDEMLAKKLISVLRHANQVVPRWMVGIEQKRESDDQNDDFAFPSNDYRSSNAMGSGRFGMPLPCEDIDDTWD